MSSVKTAILVVNFKIGNSEKKGSKTFSIKDSEEYWIMEYVFKLTGSLNIRATLTPADIEEEGIDRKGNKLTYCEIHIRYANTRNVLSQSKKYIKRGEKSVEFDFDMTIQGASYNAYQFIIIFGYVAPINNAFLSTMKELQSQSTLTDFVIRTKDSEIPCHKVVLAARSEFFRALFQTPMKESLENVLDWHNTYHDSTVQDLLHFIYTGDTPPNISETCFSLLEVAHACLLEVLKRICEQEIVSLANEDNVVDILVLGETYDSETLKQTAMNFIVDNVASFKGDVTQLPGWNKMDDKIAKNVLASVFKIMGIKKLKV